MVLPTHSFPGRQYAGEPLRRGHPSVCICRPASRARVAEADGARVAPLPERSARHHRPKLPGRKDSVEALRRGHPVGTVVAGQRAARV
jgi:hypothetical protein